MKYPGYAVSILYSHFTESISSIYPSQHLWGRYGDVFPRKIADNSVGYVVMLNKFMCDSVSIFRLDVLLRIFTDTQNKGRVIKLEDTEFHLSQKIKQLSVLPKVELCRHYDAYLLGFDLVPPLFIPNGFFEGSIKIRYGSPDYVEGFVNIDPAALNCRYVTGSGPDLNCLIEDIPGFWQPKISSVDVCTSLKVGDLNRNSLSYYKNLVNPEHDSLWVINIVSSAWRVVKYLRKYFKNEVRFYLGKYL